MATTDLEINRFGSNFQNLFISKSVVVNQTMISFILTNDPDFNDEASKELHKAIPDAQMKEEIAPGVWAIDSDVDFFTLAELWRKYPPIFVRHICPVWMTRETVETPALSTVEGAVSLPTLAQSAADEFHDLIDPSQPFSVQTRIFGDVAYKPFDVNRALSNAIIKATGAPLDVRQPEQILSVVVTPDKTYLGVSLTIHNLSDWAGGVRRFAREKGQISRAEFKLLEALEIFKITLPPRGTALDLGAAPGGWTRVLRQREQFVTAVDPAWLHNSLQNDKNVRHLRLTAEEYLNDYPDTFDLIVNDMRMDTRDSARLMNDYAKHLYKDGAAIMTFKLPGDNRQQALDHAFNILKKEYTLAGKRQLFHNRSEITVYLKKR